MKVQTILEAVAAEFEVSAEHIAHPRERRSPQIVAARIVAVKLTKDLTFRSQTEIAEIFNCDRRTILTHLKNKEPRIEAETERIFAMLRMREEPDDDKTP